MMYGGMSGNSWDELHWSGDYDHHDHYYEDPNTYWGKGNRTTRPGDTHASGRADPFGYYTPKTPPYWDPGDERQYPFDMWYTDVED